MDTPDFHLSPDPVVLVFEPSGHDGIRKRVAIKASQAMKAHCQHSIDLYENLMNVGVSKEVANVVLPKAMFDDPVPKQMSLI